MGKFLSLKKTFRKNNLKVIIIIIKGCMNEHRCVHLYYKSDIEHFMNDSRLLIELTVLHMTLSR